MAGNGTSTVEGVRAHVNPDDAAEQVASIYRALAETCVRYAGRDALTAGLVTLAALLLPWGASAALGAALQRAMLAGSAGLAFLLSLHQARGLEASMRPPRAPGVAMLTMSDGPDTPAHLARLAWRGRIGGASWVLIGTMVGLAHGADSILAQMLVGWGVARILAAPDAARRGAATHAQVQALRLARAELNQTLARGRTGAAPR